MTLKKLVFGIMILALTGCSKSTISDIAYDRMFRSDYTVYIEENDEYVPYLVLTNDYNGNTLLLRQYLLDETRVYKVSKHGLYIWDHSDYGAYYGESDIDWFLNKEYMNSLPDILQENVVDSNIIITAKSNMGRSGATSEIITRKIFLLSQEELDARDKNFVTTVSEGKKLKYFIDDYNHRYASFSNGEKCPHWTRTPENWGTNSVIAMGVDELGTGTPDGPNGVRPAFCIPNDIPIIQRSDIIFGQTVYVLDLEKMNSNE